MRSIDPCPKCGGDKTAQRRTLVRRLRFFGARRRRLSPPERIPFVKRRTNVLFFNSLYFVFLFLFYTNIFFQWCFYKELHYASAHRAGWLPQAATKRYRSLLLFLLNPFCRICYTFTIYFLYKAENLFTVNFSYNIPYMPTPKRWWVASSSPKTTK